MKRGLPNLQHHIENMQKFGLRLVVAINHFHADTDAEFGAVAEACTRWGVDAIGCTHWADGGKGAEALARAVMALVRKPGELRLLYPDAMPLAG